MKQIVALFLFSTLFTQLRAQRISQVIYYNMDGTVNNNVKTASYFTMLKIYPDHCQKLQYKKYAPLQKLWTYSDSTLNVLQGLYLEYTPEGTVSIKGEYNDNLKDGFWYHYNDTGKIVLQAKYKKGTLVAIANPDTLIKLPDSDSLAKVDIPARYKNGDKSWKKYLDKNLNIDLIDYSIKGGLVKVAFKVDTIGKVVGAHLWRSVEYVLDEEVLRVIERSPLWTPAVKNGELVNDYRLQPITFMKSGRGW